MIIKIDGYLSGSTVYRCIEGTNREASSIKRLKEKSNLINIKKTPEKEWAIGNSGKKYEWNIYTAEISDELFNKIKI